MTKKNDKRLCWNCEGNVSQHLHQCPYCGVDLTRPQQSSEEQVFKGFGSPFQTAPGHEIPIPPYSKNQSSNFSVTEDEWNSALQEKKEPVEEASIATETKKDMIALLLFLPGIVFFLFGLALVLFSNEGVLTLRWNQQVAYFYFVGSLPLLYLGWRAFR